MLLKDVFPGKLEHKVFSGNWSILRIIGRLFSEKTFGKEYITLNNNNKTIRNNEELAKIFNRYLSKLVVNLDIAKLQIY